MSVTPWTHEGCVSLVTLAQSGQLLFLVPACSHAHIVCSMIMTIQWPDNDIHDVVSMRMRRTSMPYTAVGGRPRYSDRSLRLASLPREPGGVEAQPRVKKSHKSLPRKLNATAPSV